MVIEGGTIGRDRVLRGTSAAFFCAWFAIVCSSCLVAPGGSYQVPDNVEAGDYRLGLGAGIGSGICLLPQEGEVGGEGSLWLDYGASDVFNLRVTLFGQAWLSHEGLPWAVGSALEFKAAFEQLDLAVLFGLSVAWFADFIVASPSVGVVYEFWEGDNLRLIGTFRSALGLPLMVLQLGAYLGLDIAFTERLRLRPELGTICYAIADDSRVGGCMAGVGAGLVF